MQQDSLGVHPQDHAIQIHQAFDNIKDIFRKIQPALHAQAYGLVHLLGQTDLADSLAGKIAIQGYKIGLKAVITLLAKLFLAHGIERGCGLLVTVLGQMVEKV